MPPPPKRFRYRFERLALEAGMAFTHALPRRAVTLAARLLGTLAAHLDRRGRAVALANLEAAFGDRFTPARRAAIATESYRTFARNMLDLFWSTRLRPDNWHRFIRVEGADIIRRHAGRKPGPVGISVHFGNFEWASLAWGFLGCPTMIVVEDFKNPALAPLFTRNRQVSGHTIIPQARSMVRLLKHSLRGGVSGFLADLTVPLDQPGCIIETFGLKTRCTMLHAQLALRARAPVIPFLARPLPDGTTHLRISEPLDLPPNATPAQTAQACWDCFEPTLRDEPHLWLWAYKHWRHIPTDTPRTYPFYANRSKAFDRELAGTELKNLPKTLDVD